jgi:hypothetical protein
MRGETTLNRKLHASLAVGSVLAGISCQVLFHDGYFFLPVALVAGCRAVADKPPPRPEDVAPVYRRTPQKVGRPTLSKNPDDYR